MRNCIPFIILPSIVEMDVLVKIVVSRIELPKILMVILMLFCSIGCVQQTGDLQKGKKKMDVKTIEQVLKENTDRWMSINGVVGTALGECKGKPCIKVLVDKKTSELIEKIPSTIEGYPVVIEETGGFRALEPK